MAQSSSILTTRALFKYLMRQTEKLPADAKLFYRGSIRREYRQHEEESEPERIQQIIQQTIKDAEWIVNKYSKQNKA